MIDLLTSSNKATVTSRRIGEFIFDITKTETHVSKLNITENPIETGASISDHSFLAPKELSITGVMVGYKPPMAASELMSEYLPAEISSLPLPMSVEAVTSAAVAKAQQVLSVIDNVKESVPRVLAPYLPNFSALSSDASETSDRIKKAHSDLINIQRSGELIEVMTGVELYTDMAITSITLMSVTDNAGEFSIVLREVFIVETQIAGGLSVQNAKGRAGNQAAGVAKKGKTQPKSLITVGVGEAKKLW